MKGIIKSVDSEPGIQEQLYQLIFKNAAIGIAKINREGYFLKVNRKVTEITGYTEKELLQKTFAEITHPDDLEKDLNQAEALFRGEISSYIMEKRYIRKDKTIVWVKLTGSAIFNARGGFSAFIGIIEDISEKKKTEAELTVKQKQLSSTLSSISDYYMALDRDWRLVKISSGAEKDIFKQASADITGKIIWDLFPVPDHDVFFREYERAFHENVPVHFDAFSILISKWFEVHAYPRENLLDVFFRDITRQKNSEELLRRKIEENEKIMELMPAAVWISEDPKCNLIRGNHMANQFYEAEKDENVSANVTAARRFFKSNTELKPDDLPMQKAATENKPVFNDPIDVLLPSGKVLHMFGSAIPLNDEEGNVRGAIAAFVDITKQRKTENALRKSEEKFRNLANNISQLAWIGNSKGHMLWFNKRWIDYTGFSGVKPESLKWKNIIHPEHFERVTKELSKCLKKGVIWEDTFMLKSKSGNYSWFLCKAVPVYDEKKKIISWFGTGTNIHAQQENEEKLKFDNKLFEDLLYIAAHDLKSPVANMFGVLSLMNQLPPEKKAMFLDRFWDIAHQLENTIHGITDILQVHSTDKSAASVIDIEKLLNKVLREFKENLDPASVHLTLKVQSVFYIETFLYSILKNLISNSVKYCREEVPLSIEISSEMKGSFILLTVRDNGKGIDMEKYGEKLFSPFLRFNTGNTAGTGIGLYLTKNIIGLNGGKIEVESKPGEGTSFCCYLKEYRQESKEISISSFF